MCNKLWFLTQNDSLVDVYDKEESAAEMRLYHNKKSSAANYSIFSINSSQIAKYPSEFDFARERGFIHD